MLAAMSRPPGPRNGRPTAETVPEVTRVAPVGVSVTVHTGVPMVASTSLHATDGAEPVSTATAARSPSASTARTSPTALRPSEKVTVT